MPGTKSMKTLGDMLRVAYDEMEEKNEKKPSEFQEGQMNGIAWVLTLLDETV